MAVKSILPETNLTGADVRDTLNANGGSVGDNFTSFFTSGANINKWSKFKPTVSVEPFLDDERRWKGDNGFCGFTKASIHFTDTSLLVSAYESGSTYVYKLPVGGSSEPFRMGDFRLYYPDAQAPIWDFYVNYAFVSSNTSSTIECELVDNHSGINSSYNLVLSDLSAPGSTISTWYFGCIIVANGKYFTKKHSSPIGSGSTITNRKFSVSYSEVANKCGSFSSYKVYPCLTNGNLNQFMAIPAAASGGTITGGVSGSVVIERPAVSWVNGSTYAYTRGNGVSFRGIIGYDDSLEGTSVSLEIKAINNGTVRLSYSNNIRLVHTDVANDFYRMDIEYLSKWNYQTGDTYEMIVTGGSNNLPSVSIPKIEDNEMPPL